MRVENFNPRNRFFLFSWMSSFTPGKMAVPPDLGESSTISINGWDLLSTVRQETTTIVPVSRLIMNSCNNWSGARISERPWLNREMTPSKHMKQEQVVVFKCDHFLHDLFGMTLTWAARRLPRECSLTLWFELDLYPRPRMVRILNWGKDDREITAGLHNHR